jgi:circadian clock protein KaiB
MAARKYTRPKKAAPAPRKSKRAGSKFRLKLYVTGPTARSTRAIANLKTLCNEHLQGRYELEIIDIFQQPDKAYSEQIIAAPTLVRHLTLPLRRVIALAG